MILTARWVLPISSPPIPWGAVRIVGERLGVVGPQAEVLASAEGEPVHDLGNAVLLPGLVNAHCHLDYTRLRAVGSGLEFNDWIVELTRRKMECAPEEFLDACREGARECLQNGITTVADCTDSAHAAQALHETGLRGISYPEAFGIDERDSLEAAVGRLAVKEERQKSWISERVRAGISPHAPYSVSEELFRHLDRRSREEDLPLMIHLAESGAEVRALMGRQKWKSPIREGFVQWDPPRERPVPYAQRLGLLRPGVTFIHCIQVTGPEVRALAESGAGVVSCPRSNAYLRTGVGPLRAMLDAGVRLGLGTDGACSSGPLSLFEEMRTAWFLQRSVGPGVTTQELVETATLGGARALGLEGEIGSLEPGKAADMTALSLDDPAMNGCEDPHDAVALCGSGENVILTVVGGRVLWDPRRVMTTH